MATILGGMKLNEYLTTKKNKERFIENKNLEMSTGGFVGILVFCILFLIVFIWSIVLAFKCNKNPEDAIQQFVYVLIMTTLLPIISNIIYIYYKIRNLC